jgi:hypothetical protein
MPALLARFLAVLLTVLPWATAFLVLPRAPKPEASLSSPNTPAAPQAQNAPTPAPNLTSYARDSAPPAPIFVLHSSAARSDAQRFFAPQHLEPRRKLYRAYSRWQLEGA